MELELPPEVEAKLSEEAGRLGITAMDLSRKLLTCHVSRTTSPRQQSTGDTSSEFIQNYITRMKERAPGWETRDPYAVDWQAIKAEGRKY